MAVMDSDGSNMRHLTQFDDGNYKYPVWSPGGTKIAFTAFIEDGTGGRWYQIYTINADGSGLTQLTKSQNNHNSPVWSPDGAQIAFSIRDEETLVRDIYVMNADGSNLVNLTNYPDESDETSVWSPDGTQIAFTSWRNDTADVYIMNADGSGLTRLTKGSGSERNPAWRP
jgi:TolB protein